MGEQEREERSRALGEGDPLFGVNLLQDRDRFYCNARHDFWPEHIFISTLL